MYTPKPYYVTLSILFFIGQIAYGQQPVRLGASVNSIYDEFNPVISSDSKFLFFVRRNHPDNKYGKKDSEDIWYCEATTPFSWSPAIRSRNLNIARYNSVLAISDDDQRILLNGIFNKAGTRFKKRGLSISQKLGQAWSTPQPLKIKGLSKRMKGMHTSGIWTSDEKTIILAFSEKYMSNSNDLYAIHKNEAGEWSSPKKIVALNSDGSEEAPHLSNDGKTIYFSSDREEAGKFEIYQSKRIGEGWTEWAAPTLADFPTNSVGWDSHLEMDNTEQYAFYASNHNSIGGFDIFEIDLLNRVHEVVITGKLMDEITKMPITNEPFTVMVGGEPATGVTTVLDSGLFRLKLRTHSLHEVAVRMLNDDRTASRKIPVEYEPQSLTFSLLSAADRKAKNALSLEEFQKIGTGMHDASDSLQVIPNEDKLLPSETTNVVKVIDVKTGSVITGKFDKETGRLTGMIMNNILFHFSKATIVASSKPSLGFLLRFLRQNPTTRVRIEGHTSSEGYYDYNLVLSNKRAIAVREFLLANGISKSRLETRGFGSDLPVATNETNEGKKLNRRVEITVIN